VLYFLPYPLYFVKAWIGLFVLKVLLNPIKPVGMLYDYIKAILLPCRKLWLPNETLMLYFVTKVLLADGQDILPGHKKSRVVVQMLGDKTDQHSQYLFLQEAAAYRFVRYELCTRPLGYVSIHLVVACCYFPSGWTRSIAVHWPVPICTFWVVICV